MWPPVKHTVPSAGPRASICPHHTALAQDSTVWARTLSDGSIAVALYNEGDSPRSIGTGFAALGWPATAKASVRDLWAHTDNGTVTGALGNVTVRAHATVVVRLTRVHDQ